MKCGLLYVTRKQLQQLEENIMAKADEVLHHVAEKIETATERITTELNRLEQETRRGRPSPEAIARVKASVKRLGEIVPEVEEEDHVGEGGEEEEAEKETEEP